MTLRIFDSLDDPQLIGMIMNGAVGVLPTDTVYGLVCTARDKAAVERLYALKNRVENPGTVIAADAEQLESLGLTRQYVDIAAAYWPNPISVIIPSGPDMSYLHLDKDSLAVRIPVDETLRSFLSKTGPLITTSANHPGEPVARNIQEAQNYFGDSVDFYVDVGELGERPPSTIVRINDGGVEVIREGAVKIDKDGRAEKRH